MRTLLNDNLVNAEAQLAIATQHAGFMRDERSSEAGLKRMNRPVEGVTLESILSGIRNLRANYKGKLSLQCMFMPTNLSEVEQLADSQPVRKLLNMVLLLAIKDHASDIHFEPFEDEFKMRYRIDGILYEMMPPPAHIAPAIASRIKVMAGLDIAERRLPQDGRIKLRMGKRVIDFRVSTLPTLFGEKIVLRILDNRSISVPLENLGMAADNLDLPGGRMQQPGQTIALRTKGEFESVAEIEQVILRSEGGSTVRIRDVGRVVDGFEERTSTTRLNGADAVSFSVKKQSGANTAAIA